MKKTNKTTAKATKTAKAKVIKAVEVKEPAKKITLKSIVMNEVPKMLKGKKTGLKYADIITAVQKIKDTTRNSIHGCLYSLKLNEWKGIFIAEKGKYIYKAKKS